MAKRRTIDFYKFYTIENIKGKKTLCIYGKPMDDDYIDRIVATYKSHVVPDITNERNILENVIFCIGSAGTSYEIPTRFVLSLKDLTNKEIADARTVSHLAKHGERKLKKNETDLLDTAYAFIDSLGGPRKFAQAYLANPFEMRKRIVEKVKHTSYKTASFMYLCMGGDAEMLTKDVHVNRQEHYIVSPLPEQFTLGKIRSNGKRYPDSMPDSMYVEREKEHVKLAKSTTLLDDFPIFRNSQGGLHGGLYTTLNWAPGTKMSRRLDPGQNTLFVEDSFVPPYTQ